MFSFTTEKVIFFPLRLIRVVVFFFSSQLSSGKNVPYLAVFPFRVFGDNIFFQFDSLSLSDLFSLYK